MEARMKSGRMIKGRLAETFARLGLASEIRTGAVKVEVPIEQSKETKGVVLPEEVKETRKRRTKAEIESDKKTKK